MESPTKAAASHAGWKGELYKLEWSRGKVDCQTQKLARVIKSPALFAKMPL